MEQRNSFKDLNITSEIITAVEDMGFEEPSEVQAMVIPEILSGKDVIVKSQTGTGKTAAFGIPLVEKVKIEEKEIQGLVLVPTRELAMQVCKEMNTIGRFKRLKAVAVYGGQPIEIQKKALKQRVHIIVSTPGRIMDHIERGNVQLSKVETLVIDEADKMFEMGFVKDIEAIIKKIPISKQTLLFSATISDKIEGLTKRHMREPLRIEVTPEHVTVDKIEQWYYAVETGTKLSQFLKIFAIENIEAAIVFCNTKKMVMQLTESMRRERLSVEELHGDMTQEERIRVIKDFKNERFSILVATDVAARGIDIDHISHVFNYDIPLYDESYVHRIGRTGRSGREGKAITLVTPYEMNFLKGIEEYIQLPLLKREMPTQEEIRQCQKEKSVIEDKIVKSEEMDKDKDKNKKAIKEITRLYIKAGRKNKLRPGDIVGAIIGATGLSKEDIGVIDVYDTYTYVDIMGGQGKKVLEALNNGTIKGKKIKVERANEIE